MLIVGEPIYERQSLLKMLGRCWLLSSLNPPRISSRYLESRVKIALLT